MIKMSVFLIFFLINLIKSESEAEKIESQLRDKYDGYGEEWIFMPDGDEKPQVAILKGYESEQIINRGFLDEDVMFILYTRDGPKNGTVLFNGNLESIKKSDFSPSRPTKFITHGWKSSSLSAGLINLKNAYLNKGDFNIILVDWEPLASSTFYLGPMKNTKNVGAAAGNFIDFLIEETGIKADDIHFLGHSLGAHVAGNAGYEVKSGKLGRITGLDPALPGFHTLASKDLKLDSSDAQFVDIIHSCGGILGFLQPLGTADFYPNGGVAVQPGCCCMPEITEACSHGRAYVYYAESITSDVGLSATRCTNWDRYQTGECEMAETVLMGEYVDKSASGTYFLRTRSDSPFSIEANSTYDCNETAGWITNPDGTKMCGENKDIK